MTTPMLSAIDAAHASMLFTEARSPKRFSQEPVDAELLREAWELAKFGPTGNNAMPIRLVVASSQAARAAVSGTASPGNQPLIAAAPAVLVAVADANFHHLSELTSGRADLREVLEQRGEWRQRVAHESSLLQAGYLILALRAVGLGVRPLGGFDRDALREALALPDGQTPFLILTAGHPAEDGDHGVGERAGRPGWELVATEL